MRSQLNLLPTLFLFGVAYGQQPAGVTQFLGLTPSQAAAVTQLNLTYNQLVQVKTTRENTVQKELTAEYAKPSANALALGQRYVEIDSLENEIKAAAADLQAKVAALLTPAQTALVQQIAASSAQQGLLGDASCGYLTPAITPPNFISNSTLINAVPSAVPLFAGLLLPYTTSTICPAAYPISIRNYLSLSDSQVSSILSLESAYATLQTRKTNRTNDVEVEIRDETAKPQPDPLALGVRYAEIVEISQQLKLADADGRAAARNLLTLSQQAKLKSLMDQTAFSVYQFPAASCHFISLPNFGSNQCQLN